MNTNTKKPRNRAGIIAALAVLAVAALAAPSFLGTGLFHRSPEANTQSGSDRDMLGEEADRIVAEALKDIEAIASGSARAMEEAGAGASAEIDALAEGSGSAMGQASHEANATVEAASALAGGLQEAPDGFAGGNVTPSPGADRVPSYNVPRYTLDHSEEADVSPEPYEGTDAAIRVRMALNLPITGVGALDAAALAVVSLYVDAKGDTRSAANETDGSGIVWNDDDFGTTSGNAEGVTYSAAPDEEGAAAAEAHARATLEAAQETVGSLLSGVQVAVDSHANLSAAVEAEIQAAIEAEQKAEATIMAESQARTNATWSAAAEAEAEAHAAAEQKLEVIESARVQARHKVQAAAEQRVEATTAAALEAHQELRRQASASLEAGEKAAAQIQATAEAAARAVTSVEGANQTQASAKADAILRTAAEAQAAVRAKARATADALLAQSSAVLLKANVTVRQVLSAAASAEAAIDAKAQVAVSATLRAEAYTVAKIRADAAVKAEAHAKAAAAATFRARAALRAHIQATLSAALQVNVALGVTFDGSRELGDQVALHSDAEVTKDVAYVREVAADYARQGELDRDHRADHWTGVANDLDLENEVVLATAYELQQEIEYGYLVLLETRRDIEALGQQYL